MADNVVQHLASVHGRFAVQAALGGSTMQAPEEDVRGQRRQDLNGFHIGSRLSCQLTKVPTISTGGPCLRLQRATIWTLRDGMETHLTYDTKGKHLGVLVKQRLTTTDNLQVKVVGVLNTVSGQFEYCAKFRKYFCPPKAYSRAAAALSRDYLQPVGRKAQVGLGLTYLSHTDDILAGVMARKQVLVGPATNPITLKLKAQADLNTHTSQVDGVGRFQLSKTVYRFTNMQDIQAVVGCKAHCNQKGKTIMMPYAQLRENNWTLFLDFKGYIGARYDL